MSDSLRWTQRFASRWNWFFFESVDHQSCGLLRIGYAFLLLVSLLVLMPDVERWFGEAGVLRYESSRAVLEPDQLTIFAVLPKTNGALWVCYALFLTQTTLLLIGLWSRFQSVCVFIWLVSFLHRTPMIFDGEDIVFRLLGFFLMFVPCGCAYSVDNLLRRRRMARYNIGPQHCWALRLIQIQIALIYFSTVCAKFRGATWLDGTALFYVTQLQDHFGRFSLGAGLWEELWFIRALTWGTLAVELALPILLWFNRVRIYAIIVGVFFHLGIEYTMNLFLFEWVMILGLLTFVTREDLRRLRNRLPFCRKVDLVMMNSRKAIAS